MNSRPLHVKQPDVASGVRPETKPYKTTLNSGWEGAYIFCAKEVLVWCKTGHSWMELSQQFCPRL